MADQSYVFAPQAQATLPIKGSGDAFPIHRIYCVGRNYADHAIEMGHDPAKEPPFFFQKNPDNIVTDGTFPYPTQTQDVHHEVELVVALKSGGGDLTIDQASKSIFGYAIGLDMTRRDLQAEVKKAGRPWEIAKAFEHSAPCSPILIAKDNAVLSEGNIRLTINGELRQNGNLNQMIWKLPEMISYLSKMFELKSGDIIMTGTPAGVGAVQKGDMLLAQIDGLDDLVVKVI